MPTNSANALSANLAPRTLLTAGLNIDPRRESRTRASVRVVRRNRAGARRDTAVPPRPGIGARGERDGDDGQARVASRRVGTSGVARANGRARQAETRREGPKTGDGRTGVLLILGRRGATHPRRGRACWREEALLPDEDDFLHHLFILLHVRDRRPIFARRPFHPTRSRLSKSLPLFSRCNSKPVGGCVQGHRHRRRRRRYQSASW